MASKNTIIKAIAAIKTVYNYFGKDVELSLLVDTWTALLAEYSDEEVDKGVYKALKVCKYAPVPADVIEQIETLRDIERPSEFELWARYQKALREVLRLSHRLHYNYIDDSGISQGEQARARIEEIWSGLPHELKIYLGDSSELVQTAQVLNYSEAFTFERNRFNKTLPVLQKRARVQKEIEATKKYLLEGF